MILTRRSLLAAGIAAVGWRRDTVRVTLASDADAALSDGVHFGVAEASRAMTLLGHRLELAAQSPLVIRADASIEAGGTRFLLAPEAAAIHETLQRARAAVAVPGAARVAAWHHTLFRYGASELNERFLDHTGAPMHAAHWLGWMAVKVIAEGALRAGTIDGLPRVIARARFDGHKGVALAFAPDTRRLRQPLYVIDTSRDRVIWPV